MVMLNMKGEKWCMPKYYVWSTTINHIARLSADGFRGFIDTQWVKWVRKEEDLEEDLEEDPEKVEKEVENPEEDPEEWMEKDRQEGSKIGSNIYYIKNRRVMDIDLAPEYDPDGFAEYHPRSYFDTGRDGDNDAA
ncbi:hypothetical protein FXO37_04674 [Capsicum annuum]|nr:hypothetical protein FXO37_04674 [Capsicum annuum]